MALRTQQRRDRGSRLCTHRTDPTPRGRRNKRIARTKNTFHTHTHNLPRFWTHHNSEGKTVRKPQASSPPFLDLRLRELRFDPRLFALRLAERLAFLLPPFFAAAFLREARLLGAMVRTTGNYGCGTTASNYERGGTKERTQIKGATRRPHEHTRNTTIKTMHTNAPAAQQSRPRKPFDVCLLFFDAHADQT